MKKSILILLAFVLTTSIFAQSAKPAKYKADKKVSFIKYDMTHPLHSWSGISHDVNSIVLVNPQTQKVIKGAVKVKVASFDSHNANRDSHMIDVTEALKYPYITFVTTNVEDRGANVKITGVLQFHGVKKTISFVAKKKIINPSKIQITGGFQVKVTDFKIRRPRLMGVPVEDKIVISFKAIYNKL